MTYDEALVRLKEHGQEHLLHFFEDLDEAGQESLLKQIRDLDVSRINGLYQDLVVNRETAISDELSAIPAVTLAELPETERHRLWELGLKTIADGKVCAFLVAGGQGSRLGFDGPKGAFDIGLPSGKSLFQLQAERLKHIGDLAGVSIPWYIMTSPQNHEDTVTFFKNHEYFGLKADDICFFPQGTLPSVDEDGRILMAARDEVSANPDGSGGCFRAFKEAGLLDDLSKRGIEHVFFYGVDNALVRVVDPYFIGFAVDRDKEISSKAVAKKVPEEKVGVFAYRNGNPAIIEYTELPEDLARQRSEDGKLLYGSGNIVTHVIKTSFLERVLEKDPPYHIAHKKVDHVDEAGRLVKPKEPNAWKFEALYFDLFQFADDMSILNIRREEEFSPVKNFEGVDSKDTAREMFLELCTGWVKALGIDAPMPLEISPLLSIYGDGLDRETLEPKVLAATTGYITP